MSTETIHLITPTKSATGEVQFHLPVDASLIASFEAVDLDLMVVSTTGEKFILQQGALQAAINPESKLLFNNGESLSAADQIKRLGILKPVEGGSFRLASASLSDTPEKISGNEFGLGKDAQDTAAKIEKILQALEAATQSNTADTPHSTTANGGTKTSSREAAADPLASPSPGAPPAPENRFTADDVGRVNTTKQELLSDTTPKVNNVVTESGVAFGSVPIREMLPGNPLKVKILEGVTDVTTNWKNHQVKNTLVIAGISSKTDPTVTLTFSGDASKLPPGFQIEGKPFTGGAVTLHATSGQDFQAALSWTTKPDNQAVTLASYAFGVTYSYTDGNGITRTDTGTTVNFKYGDFQASNSYEIDSAGNPVILLSATGVSYEILGRDNSNDTIFAGDGNDILNGKSGSDKLIGGRGSDTYIIDNVNDVVTENIDEGIDLVKSSVNYTASANVENLTLNGTDNINGTGNDLNNTITGNSGNNTLEGGAGVDSLTGSDGNDTYIVDSTTDIITELATTGSGTDTVQSSVTFSLVDTDGTGTNGGNIEFLTLTGSNNINGTGNSLDNTITGNSGANTLDGGAGTDTLIGGAGDDTYIVDNTGDVVTELTTQGTDLIQSSVTYTASANVENLTLTGTDNLSGTGNNLNNTITGNSGNNTLDGGAGVDNLLGGVGNDTYIVDNVNDMVTEYLGEGIDLIQSSVTYTASSHVENLTLTGIAAINGTGNALDNTLTGNSGANTLDGGAGLDALIGGDGNDIYIVDSATDIITETITGGADTVQSSVNYILGINLEDLTLIGSATVGTGNSLDNLLIANNAGNTLSGLAGKDTLTGGTGSDILIGGAGADTLNGGAGNDTASYAGSTAAVTVSLVTGATNIGGDAAGDVLSNIENLIGSSLNDTLTGDGGDNVLNGGAGNDSMAGGAGNDTYIVDSSSESVTEALNAGTDTVQSSVNYTLGSNLENLTLTGTTATVGTGNSLDNLLIANNAGNTLSGLAGKDTLTGGTGSDILIGGAGADTLNGGAGNDTASYAGSTAAVIVSLLSTATNTGGDATGDKLSYIENLIGSSYNDTLTGDGGDNVLNGGAGNDSMAGGAGNDTYFVDSASDSVTEAAGAGADNIRISGITSFNLSAIQATHIESLDLRTDASANNVTLSSSAIKALVSLGNSSILKLSLGGNDSYNIAAESNVFFTDTRGSTTFYSNAAKTDQIAQVLYV